MKKVLTLLIISLTLPLIHLHAQIFTNYTEADGLISNFVNCVALDADDNVWFGTKDGISFFDGTTWTNFDQTSHPALVDNNVLALDVDTDNNLWIGTDFGVNKFDGTNWTTYSEADGLADDRIKYINQSDDGRIWFANNDGISILDGTTWTSYVLADGIPFGGINFVTFDTNGKAWLGTPLAGILIFDGTGFSEITENEGLLNDKVRSIAISSENEKWIGTADGISVFDANNNFVEHHELIFELPPPDLLNPVEDVQIDPAGRIWVGVYIDYLVTEGGITMYENSAWTDYNVSDGLVGPVVRRLAIDSENIVWVVTSSGVSRIGEIPTSNFDIEIQNGIQVFPNPTSDKVTFEIPIELIGSEFKIFNNVGVLLQNGTIRSENQIIDLKNMANGIYFISIDRTYTKKVIVKK
jgi:ligand-binding sensor domain-containing protein